MELIPITRTRSGRAAPARPTPADTRITADHGLHTIELRGTARETAWTTVITLWIDGRPIAHALVWTSPASEPDETAERPAVQALTAWSRVLVALVEIGDLEDQLIPLQAEIADAKTLGEHRPILDREWDEIQSKARTLRAVAVERARTIGHRSGLDGIALGPFQPELPSGNSRVALALQDLTAWGERHQDRDEVIEEAAAVGIGGTEIHRRTGVARTTVDRVLG